MSNSNPSSGSEALLLENKRLKKALQTAELCFTQLNEVVFSITENGFLTFLNPAWEKMTGFSVEDSLHKTLTNYLYYDDTKKVSLVVLNPDILQI